MSGHNVAVYSAFTVVAAVDLRNMIEGERQLAWSNLIEYEMMGAH